LNGSPSKRPVRIRVAGLGVAEGELVRFYAPLTVEKLMSRLPLEGRAHPIRGGYSFIVDIKRGEEKSVREVEAGTIAYWPMGNSICIFHSTTPTISPVNRIGRVTENLELMTRVSSGARIRIEKF